MTTDERLDESISIWLEQTASTRLPDRVLEATFERTRRSRQHVRWGGLLGAMHLTRSTIVLGGTAAIVVAALLALGPRVAQPSVGGLPTTPDAWSRVSIDSRWASAQVDALVAGPRGLLAILGESGSHKMQLSISTDGRTWRLVPNEQFPSDAVLLPPPRSLRLPAVGTTNGFLFVADGNDVWASEDGDRWQRLTDRARDQDLRAGSVLAVAVGGPGLIAVGSDNKAWYSEDGSDWTQAEVPAPPTASFKARGLPPPNVAMQGVAVSGQTFVAWGTASSSPGSNEGMQETVLWTSKDGKSWANVPDEEGIEPLRTVVAGPGGFVATDMNGIYDARAIRFSADGRSWETVDAFKSRLPSHDEGLLSSVAAASSGYVAVGGDGKCAKGPCPDAVATIWTSPDGRSWSRLPDGGPFEVADPQDSENHSGAWATSVVAWDSRFVVAGAYDASPVVWISGTPGETEAPIVTSTPTESNGTSATPSPSTSTTEVAPPSEVGITELLNGFLEARVAGVGAQPYLSMAEEDVPLLYATTSGAPYERAEFEPVPGIDWPYGLTAFKVRLFAADTVVEQIFFTGLDESGLRYQPDAYGTDIAPTTEDGEPVAVPFNAFGGEVTMHVAHPWIFRDHSPSVSVFGRLIPEGPGVLPTTDGGERTDWDELFVLPDPALLGTGCQQSSDPADAAALAESIRSGPDLGATPPVAVTVGGADALVMDVRIAAGATICVPATDGGDPLPNAVMAPLFSYEPGASFTFVDGRALKGPASGDRMRLYLIDAPDGSSMQALAIAIVAAEPRFERAVEAAAPVIDSIEFHAP